MFRKTITHFAVIAFIFLSGSSVGAQSSSSFSKFSLGLTESHLLGAASRTFQSSPIPGVDYLTDIGIIPEDGKVKIPSFAERFAKGQTEFGLQLGYGFTFDLPKITKVEEERTNIDFAFIAPNFKYNLTGVVGKSFYQGALYWVVETSASISLLDPDRNNLKVDSAPTYVFGITPLQLEYKFVKPNRKWGPFVFGGVGFSVGDWHKGSREISTAFEFILQGGGGLEYFLDNGHSIYFNYRFWHLSNSNIKSPNIGLNAHVFAMGVSF